LAASGYRASREAHHYRVIQSLAHTIGLAAEMITRLEAFRKKRNICDYELAGTVSDQEAREMIALTRTLRDDLVSWLSEHHPELVGDRP
jgi:hypothetical protein